MKVLYAFSKRSGCHIIFMIKHQTKSWWLFNFVLILLWHEYDILRLYSMNFLIQEITCHCRPPVALGCLCNSHQLTVIVKYNERMYLNKQIKGLLIDQLLLINPCSWTMAQSNPYFLPCSIAPSAASCTPTLRRESESLSLTCSVILIESMHLTQN